jgi:hypothetical protein
MVFAQRLRQGVVRGQITCSIRIWIRPHVKAGARYRLGEGEIEIESIPRIGFPDIPAELAQASGFLGILDLLKVAKHGKRRQYLSDSVSLRASTTEARCSPQEGQRWFQK